MRVCLLAITIACSRLRRSPVVFYLWTMRFVHCPQIKYIFARPVRASTRRERAKPRRIRHALTEHSILFQGSVSLCLLLGKHHDRGKPCHYYTRACGVAPSYSSGTPCGDPVWGTGNHGSRPRLQTFEAHPWLEVLDASRAVISKHLLQAISCKFFNACLCQDYRHHRLAYYTCGRDDTDITTLVTARINIFACGQVYRG